MADSLVRGEPFTYSGRNRLFPMLKGLRTLKRLLMIIAAFALLSAPALALSKAQEFARIDSSITPLKIYGNPYKYKGRYAKLHCMVRNVVDSHEANVACDNPNNDSEPIVALLMQGAKVGNMDAGQEMWFIAYVVGGTDGKDTAGVDTVFATIRYDYSL